MRPTAARPPDGHPQHALIQFCAPTSYYGTKQWTQDHHPEAACRAEAAVEHENWQSALGRGLLCWHAAISQLSCLPCHAKKHFHNSSPSCSSFKADQCVSTGRSSPAAPPTGPCARHQSWPQGAGGVDRAACSGGWRGMPSSIISTCHAALQQLNQHSRSEARQHPATGSPSMGSRTAWPQNTANLQAYERLSLIGRQASCLRNKTA